MDSGAHPGPAVTGPARPREPVVTSDAEKARLFDSLLGNLRAMVYRCRHDAAWTMRYVSEGARELTGHAPEEFLTPGGVAFADLILPEDRARVAAEVAQALAKGKRFDLEYRIRAADGTVKWLSERGAGVKVPGATEWEIEGVVTDVSLLKRAEVAIAERDECFSLAFNSARDMMVLARVEPGPTFRVVALNRSYEMAMQLAGVAVSNATCVGKTFEELRPLYGLSDDAWAVLIGRYHEVIRTGTTMRFEEVADIPGGRFVGDSTITPVLGPDGSCRFVLYASADVSERRRVERELRETAEKFAKAFHASPGAMSISEPGGRGFIAVNDNYVRMFGYGREELLGRSLTDLGLWTTAQRDAFVAAFRERGSVRDLEVVRRRRDGTEITCLLSAESIELDGRPCVIAALYDITERRQAERSLRESEERFSKAFHATPDAVLITDKATGVIVDANEGCARIYGYARNECIGRTTLQLGMWQDPADRGRFMAALEAGRGSVRDLEVAGRARSGMVVSVLLSCETIEVLGRPHLVTIAHDITERKAAERALRESEDRFSSAFRASPGAMIIADAESRRFVEVNEGFCRLFGRSRDELIGRDGLELGLWPDAETRERFWQHLQRDGTVNDLEVATRNPAGAAVVYLVSARFVTLGGRQHYITMVLDITARKQSEAARAALEEQLRQTQKLEALGQLAGGIAHDFNNILTGIVAYTELALLDLGRTDEVRRHLGAVRSASDRARDLVRQILTFSRRQPPERSPLRLGGVVSEALRLLRSSIPATIAIDEAVDPVAPVVLADKSQVHQVVMNLGTNAAHAMRGRPGRLTIGLEGVTVGPGGMAGAPDLAPGRYARISVTDTGHGMDETTLRRIFEPFFTTKPPGEGTGLGLAVVHGIVREHQGTVAVHSRPGEGTRFEVYLPEHVAPVAEEAAPRLELPAGNGERILLVDDEGTIIAAATVLLQRLRYEVAGFEDPREAWAVFQSRPGDFDLVVTDLTMPHLNGKELARRITSLRPDLPVLLTSGLSGDLTQEAMRALGIRALLPKPVSALGLARAVREALDGVP